MGYVASPLEQETRTTQVFFRNPKSRDSLALFSWKRQYRKEALTLPHSLALIRSLPGSCIPQQGNPAPLLQAMRAYSDGQVPLALSSPASS